MAYHSESEQTAKDVLIAYLSNNEFKTPSGATPEDVGEALGKAYRAILRQLETKMNSFVPR